MDRDQTADAAPTRILIVEDVAADAELVLHELQRSGLAFTHRHVQTEATLRAALRSFAPDIVLSDHSLPQFNASDALRVVREEAAHTPVIIVTGSLDEETAAEYIKAGAADYIVKHRLQRLGPAVQRALELRRALEDATRAEAARRRSTDFLDHTQAVAHVGSWEWDIGGDVITWSQETYRIFGVAPLTDPISYERYMALIHPEDRDAVRAAVRRSLWTLEPFDVDHRIIRSDGSVRFLYGRGGVLSDADGRPARLTGAVLDVTARRQAEEALRRANDHLEAVVQSAPLAIFSLDAEGRVTTWNPAAEHLFGWTAAEVLGEALPIVPLEGRGESQEIRQHVLRGESLTGVELVRQKKDGTTVTVNLFAAPLHDAAGHTAGILALLEDVTGVKRLEQQFLQAQRMEAVGRLAAGVAHDFNNLLTAILGSSEFLLEILPVGHAGREDAEETRNAALRAADLTRQLLAFSRQQVLAPRVLSVNEVVIGMDKLLRRLIGEDVDLRTVLAQDVGAVRADAGQLEQVIVNLAMNARDAMPDGGKVTIETANVVLGELFAAGRVVVAPGSYVVVAVSDTGMGMDANTQARAFEPFFTTKPKGKGTGLGLATVYGIVRQSGGYVWLYSEPGSGTTFKVYLPRVDAPPEPSPGAAATVGSLRGSETILLAEDQDEVRALTRRILEKQGYRVLVAANGGDALRLAEQHGGTIDLLLTDVVMPGMGGAELRLRLGPLHPEMKVLFLSGYTDEAILHHGVLDPGVAFLQKPFTPEILARKVREVLGPAK
jgi:PAS domain S-box-containing protein